MGGSDGQTGRSRTQGNPHARVWASRQKKIPAPGQRASGASQKLRNKDGQAWQAESSKCSEDQKQSRPPLRREIEEIMAKSPNAGQPAITRAGSYDSDAAKQMQDVTCNGVTTSLIGSADPIAFPGNIAIDATGVDACTLATPKAGQQPAGDD